MAKRHWKRSDYVVTDRVCYRDDGIVEATHGYCRVCLADMQAFASKGWKPLHYNSHQKAKRLGIWGNQTSTTSHATISAVRLEISTKPRKDGRPYLKRILGEWVCSCCNRIKEHCQCPYLGDLNSDADRSREWAG